ARWLGVDRSVLFKLNSPIDITLLRRFAANATIEPGTTLWEMMRWIGDDLIGYLTSTRQRLDYLSQNAEFWEIQGDDSPFRVLYLPRQEPLPDEPTAGLARFLDGHPEGSTVAGLVYPDRRGTGYGISRHNDHPGLDFTRIGACEDVRFA